VNYEKKDHNMGGLFDCSSRLDWIGFCSDCKASNYENRQIVKWPRSF